MLTQKYKQQQQQVRVQTSESNYAKGMFFSDAPLTEGYSKVLVNWDIDSITGKLTPRKGLRTVLAAHTNIGYPSIPVYSNALLRDFHYAYTDVHLTPTQRSNSAKQRLLGIAYFPEDTSKHKLTLLDMNTDPEGTSLNAVHLHTIVNGYGTTNAVYRLHNPEIHNIKCRKPLNSYKSKFPNTYFDKPIGTFAFNDSYYTFLQTHKLAENIDDFHYLGSFPNSMYNYTYRDLLTTSRPEWGEIAKDYSHALATGTPGDWFVIYDEVNRKYLPMYYDSEGNLKGSLRDNQYWPSTTIEGAKLNFNMYFPTDVVIFDKSLFCYTKQGKDIQSDEVLLDKLIDRTKLDPTAYYACILDPTKINPTNAVSSGYNMLLDDPYTFENETTATNTISILGIIPYDTNGKVMMSPQINKQFTLKAYLRAPAQYHSDTENKKWYTTTKQQIDTTDTISYTTDTTLITELTLEENSILKTGSIIIAGSTINGTVYTSRTTLIEDITVNANKATLAISTVIKGGSTIITQVTRDPKNFGEIMNLDATKYNYGDWWYLSDLGTYWMVQPNIPEGETVAVKAIRLYGETKPAASVQLSGLNTGDPDSVRVRWRYRAMGASDWMLLSDEEITDLSQPLTCTANLSANEVIIQLLITDPLDTTGINGEEYVIANNTLGLSLVSENLATVLNLNTINYDLSTCSGMTEWEQRLVLWGVHEAPNTVFISDVNNPGYFPYPNNVDVFPEVVRAVYNFGNELLVLTASALYKLSWNADGNSWTHTLLQQNLDIAEKDIPMCCVLKNMFFFKSGNYYYALAPKNTASTGVRGEMNITPISKPINALLDNFQEEVEKLIGTIADIEIPKEFKENLINYFVSKTDSKVIYNYVYDYSTAYFVNAFREYNTTQGIAYSEYEAYAEANAHTSQRYYVYIQLIYDTSLKVWSTRTFVTANCIYPIENAVLQTDAYVYALSYTALNVSSEYPSFYSAYDTYLFTCDFNDITKNNNIQCKDGRHNYQLVYDAEAAVASEDSVVDCLVHNVSNKDSALNLYGKTPYVALATTPSTIRTWFNPDDTSPAQTVVINKPFDNYQFLDTGNRDLNTDMKKRFREFQFKMRNVNATSLGFHTSFLIDGSLRRDLQKYTPRYLTDPETGEMVIVIERTLDEASINYLSFVPAYKVTRVEYAVASTKMLQDDGELTPTTLAEYNDPDKWVIDQSAFPGRTFWKVRVSISGKGYTPRAQLLSTNLKYFEVFGHSWVYRTMHGR